MISERLEIIVIFLQELVGKENSYTFLKVSPPHPNILLLLVQQISQLISIFLRYKLHVNMNAIQLEGGVEGAGGPI